MHVDAPNHQSTLAVQVQWKRPLQQALLHYTHTAVGLCGAGGHASHVSHSAGVALALLVQQCEHEQRSVPQGAHGSAWGRVDDGVVARSHQTSDVDRGVTGGCKSPCKTQAAKTNAA